MGEAKRRKQLDPNYGQPKSEKNLTETETLHRWREIINTYNKPGLTELKFSTYAWRGYKLYGAGVLVRLGEQNSKKLLYAPLDEFIRVNAVTRDLLKLIRSYDPEKEFVLANHTDNGDRVTFVVEPEISPKAAAFVWENLSNISAALTALAESYPAVPEFSPITF